MKNTKVELIPLTADDREQFILDNQWDRNAARQDTPVCMIWDMSAEELMTIANKRLCRKASKETREVVRKMCDLVLESCPEFEGLLVPNCLHNGGICYEMQPCLEEEK